MTCLWWQDSSTKFVNDRLLLRDRWFQVVALQEGDQNLWHDQANLFCPHAGELFNGFHMKEAFYGAIDHVCKPENCQI